MSVNKKVIVAGGVFAVTLMAPMMAEAAAVPSSASSQTISIASGAAGGYVVESFSLNVSAHTALDYIGGPTVVGVKAGNSKGMHTFGGSSAGGAVKACETSSVTDPAASLGAAGTATGCN